MGSEAAELAADLVKFTHDPLGYVRYAYPWGVGELKGYAGPRVWQEKFLGKLGDQLKARASSGVWSPICEAVVSGHGPGKAQPKNIVIYTPKGRQRWGDLKIGDALFGESGDGVRIVAIHDRGVLPVYRVTLDDRSSTLACGEHLWKVRGRKGRRVDRPGGKSGEWNLLSTEEILRRGTKRKNGARLARQWELPRIGTVSYAIDSEPLPVTPYMLGVWLGDGGRNCSVFTKADSEIAEALRIEGYTVTARRDPRSKASSYCVHGLRSGLRELGILDKYCFEKSVPRAYIEASPSSRILLLRGLLDTDGEVGKDGSIGFCSTSKPLADDVIHLARSLGGKAMMQRAIKHPTYTDGKGKKLQGRDAYRVTLNMPPGIAWFNIKRKQDRIPAAGQDRYRTRWIESIEPAGRQDCMCVTVDHPRGMYLTNDFIPTHNSATVAWLTDWALSTREDTRVVVTANTATQLGTKTWPELSKWRRLAINKGWFEYTSTALASVEEGHGKNWRADALPWSENRTEAFAGLHNQGKRIVVLFDEASSISDRIWEVTEGALTDEGTEIIWCVFGNPTRTTGRLRECFGRLQHRWGRTQIDSRDVEGANKAYLESLVADYGEDSDVVRVRVRGVFPRASVLQLIDAETVAAAMKREASFILGDQLVMGIDVARGGDDNSVIQFRRGMDARTIPTVILPGSESRDSMRLVSLAGELIARHKPAAVFVDATGIGGPVADRLRQLGHRGVVDVQFGGASPDPKCVNMRTYMWVKMRDWLRSGGAIPDSPELEQELTSIEYSHDSQDRLVLEKKDHLKSRGLASPDRSDALSVTWAYPVMPKPAKEMVEESLRRKVDGIKGWDYDPISDERMRVN